MPWEPFQTGLTLGQSGSEDGTIIRDEVYEHRARITLEHNALIAPFAITCGIFGWMAHTRYFGSQAEADAQFEQMKQELAGLVSFLVEGEGKKKLGNISSRLKKFVERFP